MSKLSLEDFTLILTGVAIMNRNDAIRGLGSPNEKHLVKNVMKHANQVAIALQAQGEVKWNSPERQDSKLPQSPESSPSGRLDPMALARSRA